MTGGFKQNTRENLCAAKVNEQGCVADLNGLVVPSKKIDFLTRYNPVLEKPKVNSNATEI